MRSNEKEDDGNAPSKRERITNTPPNPAFYL